MKYTGPKAKRCRRHGVNLYGSDKYDKILQRKPYGPGKDPRDSQRGKPSEYSVQLKEKQKARDMYGLSEKQFHRYYAMATKVSGQTGDHLKQLLERRLDNLIYRAGFAQTRFQSRQFVGHGHFLVNGRRVTVPSYLVKPGDVITARARSKASPVFGPIIDAHQKYLPPNWMKADAAALKVEVTALPGPEHAEQAVDVRQIIEFYSRT
ncbi:MAG: 30S ribosomal protein S4 [Candidatus Peribacteraceae bacterium]|nr:30S ribosomal protein S4 [Candidatus Peribacteraceae bacterium]